jgi:hypothetical protein
MTAALHDEVVTVRPARALRVVPDYTAIQAPIEVAAPEKTPRRPAGQPFFGVLAGDPLVEGAARLLSVPVRHVYAALWRAGVIEVQA